MVRVVGALRAVGRRAARFTLLRLVRGLRIRAAAGRVAGIGVCGARFSRLGIGIVGCLLRLSGICCLADALLLRIGVSAVLLVLLRFALPITAILRSPALSSLLLRRRRGISIGALPRIRPFAGSLLLLVASRRALGIVFLIEVIGHPLECFSILTAVRREWVLTLLLGVSRTLGLLVAVR